MSRLARPVCTRRRVFVFVLALLQIAAVGVSMPSLANAGNWVEVSCLNPNQSAAPSEGWSSFTTGSPEYGSNNLTSCSPGNPMYAILSTEAPAPSGAGEDLQYTPPAGSILTGGSIDMNLYADGGGYDTSGTAILYSPAFQYDGSDVVIQCARSLTPCSNGTSDFSGVQSIPANRGGNLYVSATCGGSGSTCNEGGSHGAWALAQVAWANILLSNNSTPAASNVSGSLLDPDASGTQGLTLNATDPGGPGVYTVTVQVDDATLYSATPNNNGGKCVPVGNSGTALMFDYNQPCKQTENVEIPINTASLSDGSHNLKVLVTDAANNTSTVYNATITTENAPMVTSSPSVSGSDQVGSTLTGVPAVFQARSGLGPLGAVSGQWLRCSGPGTGCSAIVGATSTAYTPVAGDEGYTIEYENSVEDAQKHQATSTSAPTVAVAEAPGSGGSCTSTGCSGGNGSNGSNGSSGGNGANGNNGAGGAGGSSGAGTNGSGVTVVIPGGGSSLGSTPLGSTAKWNISLKVSPTRVHRHTKVKLVGQVSTYPRPSEGKLVYLQARSVSFAWRGRGSGRHRVTVYGKWISFQVFRANDDGSFASTYTFKLGGRHTYQFQAVAPAEGQFRNPTGTSSTMTIREI